LTAPVVALVTSKEVDAKEQTVRFAQEIYDAIGLRLCKMPSDHSPPDMQQRRRFATDRLHF
jgi:hypothetical protein